MRRIIIVFILSLICHLSFAQGEVGYLYEEMPTDSVQAYSVKTHTALRPFIRQYDTQGKKGSYFRASALGDLNYVQMVYSGYKTGLGVELNTLLKDKWHFRLAAVEGLTATPQYYTPKTYISDSVGAAILYTDIRSRLSYTPNHIFNFQAGLDHQFVGEGSRSLLLSDYGVSYPFGQIRMRFWRVEYSILYQFLRERDNNRWEGKFASSHYLSLNVAKWLNLGVFESVIFQPKDTAVNRGFDAEYLNPFVFFRPQEYSLGSSDNVLLGITLSAKYKQHMLYGQFILDEFVLAEIRAKSKWWANKYGGQFGVKGRFSKNNHHFFYRIEYNFVRPYTYAHLSEEINYGNQGSVLAHPYGGNFMEILGEFKWQKGKWFARFFSNFYMRGADKDGYSYGGDIYAPYTFRPFEYGHKIGQGERMTGSKTILTFGYAVLKHGKLSAFMENHLDYLYQSNDLPRYSIVVGIRSMLWNDYRNY